ncbi:MliC family protein [Agrobacterium tumefaciens]|uniref:MliC family protein n=1 Tax=Agrobacterium tumefaciens TaxID=358 RepID=UPI00287D3859|nr:MliC family protein [Agrobacterium tumefaciens]MDS7597421.1 MliC family protein [Agrobacterium tumefaciens]
MKKSAAIISFMTAVSSLFFTGAIAENLVIPLPEETTVEKTEAVYQCGSEKVGATYLTTGDVGLVRIAFAGRIIVASSVISGSGAKYQGGCLRLVVQGRRGRSLRSDGGPADAEAAALRGYQILSDMLAA